MQEHCGLLHDKVTRCFTYKPPGILDMLLVNIAACVQHRALSSLCISDLLPSLRDDGSGYPNSGTADKFHPPHWKFLAGITPIRPINCFPQGVCLCLFYLQYMERFLGQWQPNSLSTLRRTAHWMSGMVQMQPLVKTTPAMRELAEIREKMSYQCCEPKSKLLRKLPEQNDDPCSKISLPPGSHASSVAAVCSKRWVTVTHFSYIAGLRKH